MVQKAKFMDLKTFFRLNFFDCFAELFKNSVGEREFELKFLQSFFAKRKLKDIKRLGLKVLFSYQLYFPFFLS